MMYNILVAIGALLYGAIAAVFGSAYHIHMRSKDPSLRAFNFLASYTLGLLWIIVYPVMLLMARKKNLR